MPKEIHVSQPISIPEARELLIKREHEAREKRQDLSYMQGVALDHALIVSRTTGTAARQLIEDLIENHRISNLGAIALANTLPDTIDEIRQVLEPESRKMTTEVLEEILELIQHTDRLKEEDYMLYSDVDEDMFYDDEKELPDDIPDI